MKTLSLLLVSLTVVMGIAQERVYTFSEVDQMAIYSGCEQDKDYLNAPNDTYKKSALAQCLLVDIREKIMNSLNKEKLNRAIQKENTQYLFAKVSYIVDSQGNITEVQESNGSSSILSKELIKSFKKVQNDLKRDNVSIKPAKVNGKAVSVQFEFPVRYFQN